MAIQPKTQNPFDGLVRDLHQEIFKKLPILEYGATIRL